MNQFIGKIFVFCGMMWAIGFTIFVIKLPSSGQCLNLYTDGIVVLTGGPERVQVALSLLNKQLTSKLLISGVHPQTHLKDILRVSSLPADFKSSKIDLDYTADSTFGNAQQSAQWSLINHFKSLRLVTAHYHMPRAILEFHRTMPDLKIIEHPVVTKIFKNKLWIYDINAWEVLHREYYKYIGALLFYNFKNSSYSF